MLTRREKKLALAVFQYKRQKHPGKTVEKVVRLTAKATGISDRTIYKIRKELSDTQNLVTPGKRKGKGTRDQKCDDFTKKAVRYSVHD